jgi:hypothetical protein
MDELQDRQLGEHDRPVPMTVNLIALVPAEGDHATQQMERGH